MAYSTGTYGTGTYGAEGAVDLGWHGSGVVTTFALVILLVLEVLI